MTADRASDGPKLWAGKATYRTRPVLVGRTIYALGGARDPLTLKVDLLRSWGRGPLTASARLSLYPSPTLGYHDVASPKGPDATPGCRNPA